MLDKVNTVEPTGPTKRKFEEDGQDSNAGQKDAKLMRTEANDGSWTCFSCTFVNRGVSLEACEKCAHPKYTVAMLQKKLDEIKERTSFVEPPLKWQPVYPGTRLKRVVLAENDGDYLDITKTLLKFSIFHTSASMSSKTKALYSITKIERIENLALYRLYSMKKEEMKEENGPEEENEKRLWHGTSPECANSIATYGFNRSHCGKNGTCYGKGVYFSKDPDYASRARYATPDQSGLQCMFYSRVLTGRHTIGSSVMVEPPELPKKSGRYNSLADDCFHPSIFVIFHDAQAYPEFLITFKTLSNA